MARQESLPDADEMFLRFFDHWYTDDTRELKGFSATRPDMMDVPEYVGQRVEEICPLADKAAADVHEQVQSMREAAAADWPTYLPVRAPIDLQWVDAFDQHYDAQRVADLIRRSDPNDFSNDYLVITCEFGAVLGLVMTQALPRLRWLPSWPYWESSIFDSTTGSVIPVFHWAIKKFSGYGIDDGFARKLQACIQLLNDNSAR